MDFYTLLSAVCFMALLNTLKLILTGRVAPLRGKALLFLFHPAWLISLGGTIPLVIGYYVSGKMSPWPPAAFAAAGATAGEWAGILAALSALTVDIWMFWATAAALLTFTDPLAVNYPSIPKSMNKYFYITNVLAGCLVVWSTVYKHAF